MGGGGQFPSKGPPQEEGEISGSTCGVGEKGKEIKRCQGLQGRYQRSSRPICVVPGAPDPAKWVERQTFLFIPVPHGPLLRLRFTSIYFGTTVWSTGVLIGLMCPVRHCFCGQYEHSNHNLTHTLLGLLRGSLSSLLSAKAGGAVSSGGPTRAFDRQVGPVTPHTTPSTLITDLMSGDRCSEEN